MGLLRTNGQILIEKEFEKEFEDTISNIIQTDKNEWIINFRKSGKIIKLDENLKTIWEKDLQAQDNKYVSSSIRISKNENFIAISSIDKIRIFDKKGKNIFTETHNEWYSFNGSENFFSNDEAYFVNILPFEKNNDDLLQIRDTKTFQVIKEITIPCGYSFYNFFNTRLNHEVIIEAARGQDEGITYILTIDTKKTKIEEWKEFSDRIIGNISLENNTVVTAPHYGDEIILYSLKNRKPITIIKEKHIFNNVKNMESDGFSYIVKFIASDLILLQSRLEKFILFDLKKGKVIGQFITGVNKILGYNLFGEVSTYIDKVDSTEGKVLDYFGLMNSKILINQGGTKLVIYKIKPVQYSV